MRNCHTRDVSITQWTAFVEVCRTGSLRAAAEATGFTQPGLSRQIASLERDLGVRLFQRGPRGVTPTPAGSALLPHARLVVGEALRGSQAARSAAVGANHLMIGAVPSAAAALVPVAIRSMRDSLPQGPHWSLVSGLTPRLAEMVLSREIDVAVITDAPPGLPHHAELRARHLVDDEMVVLTARDHRLAGRTEVDITELAAETWVEDNAGSETLLRQLASRAGFEVRLSPTADDLITKTALVAAGLGVALVPHLLVPALRADLAVLSLHQSVRRGIYLLTRDDRPPPESLTGALTKSAGMVRFRREAAA
jgi:DNA-binding transcriptional LysR family regulator